MAEGDFYILDRCDICGEAHAVTSCRFLEGARLCRGCMDVAIDTDAAFATRMEADRREKARLWLLKEYPALRERLK